MTDATDTDTDVINPADCPYCQSWVANNPEWGPDKGHIDNCPALYETWSYPVSQVADQLAEIAGRFGGIPGSGDGWRADLRKIAAELLAIADWPTRFLPGSLSEAAYTGQRTDPAR